MSYWPQKRIFGGEALQYAPGFVDRAVVDDYHLVAVRCGSKRHPGLLHEDRKILRFVFCGNENAYIGPALHRLKRVTAFKALPRVGLRNRGHTRLRIRAESTPS